LPKKEIELLLFISRKLGLDEVQSLLQQPGYRRNYYERHEQQWKNLCTKYIDTGGKVYPITSADAKEILAKLTLCPELNDG